MLKACLPTLLQLKRFWTDHRNLEGLFNFRFCLFSYLELDPFGLTILFYHNNILIKLIIEKKKPPFPPQCNQCKVQCTRNYFLDSFSLISFTRSMHCLAVFPGIASAIFVHRSFLSIVAGNCFMATSNAFC